jgi:hypothetical protein
MCRLRRHSISVNVRVPVWIELVRSVIVERAGVEMVGAH